MNLNEEIIKTIKSNIEKDIDIKPETKFEELELDSFGIIILVDAFEQKFNVSIKDKEFIEIKTINDVIKKIQNMVN
jgi:acyl carrier protein